MAKGWDRESARHSAAKKFGKAPPYRSEAKMPAVAVAPTKEVKELAAKRKFLDFLDQFTYATQMVEKAWGETPTEAIEELSAQKTADDIQQIDETEVEQATNALDDLTESEDNDLTDDELAKLERVKELLESAASNMEDYYSYATSAQEELDSKDEMTNYLQNANESAGDAKDEMEKAKEILKDIAKKKKLSNVFDKLSYGGKRCLGCGGTGYVTKMPEAKTITCRLCGGMGY